MATSLLQFLSKYATLSEEEVQLIKEQNIIREFKKESILLKEGQIAKECYLVLKGCVRIYYLIDGDEKTTEIFTENEAIIPVSYTKQEPSACYITCVEDCILSLGNADSTAQFINTFPKFAPIISKISNDLLANQQISADTYKNLSPEKRYQKLVELRPDLVQRVAQYHLASYLGIKPQSLSRIRKRLSKA